MRQVDTPRVGYVLKRYPRFSETFIVNEILAHEAAGLDVEIFSLRPHPKAARYRTPVAGLYLCGSGSHPGGGVSGAPGRNAARRVIRDIGHRWRA